MKWGATKPLIPAFVLFVIPVIGLIGLTVWSLHSPKPRIKTAVIINRNSLLPHRYVGPCLNCHKIQGSAPVAMNESNMLMFRLSEADRVLLKAGQRVDVQTAVQQAAVPAITRSDILPHPYIGVCSNCHVVLDMRPSRRFMQKAMQGAYQPITNRGWDASKIKYAGASPDRTRDDIRIWTGFLALALLLVGCGYIAERIWMRLRPKSGRLMGGNLKKWLVVHEWSLVAFCGASVLHWYYSDRGNNFLHLALILVIWLTAAGFVLRYRMTHKTTKSGLRLLHSQQVLFFAVLILLVGGHLMPGWG